MGRHMKVTPEEVLDTLLGSAQKGAPRTKRDLAQTYDVCNTTIASKIRTLREDGNAIIHDRDGYRLISKELLQEWDGLASTLESFINWSLKIVRSMYVSLDPTGPILPEMKRQLGDGMTQDERRLLGKQCVKVKALLDHMEAESEFG